MPSKSLDFVGEWDEGCEPPILEDKNVGKASSCDLCDTLIHGRHCVAFFELYLCVKFKRFGGKNQMFEWQFAWSTVSFASCPYLARTEL